MTSNKNRQMALKLLKIAERIMSNREDDDAAWDNDPDNGYNPKEDWETERNPDMAKEEEERADTRKQRMKRPAPRK